MSKTDEPEAVAERTYTPDDLVWASRRLSIVSMSVTAAMSHAVGINPPELLALAHLDHDGKVGPSELARRLQLTTGAVTALVDRLEESGHLERAAHPTDRRRVLLRRTAKAEREVAEEVGPMVREILELAESLSDDERQVVGAFLDKLAAVMERMAETERWR
jgi:DNA-binding MarR family transcriptional regulator